MGAGAIPVNIGEVFREQAKKRSTSKQKLRVFTADAGYEGDDGIDVSFHGGHFILTPPKPLLIDYKLGRRSREQFQEEYFAFLENSFVQYQHTWDNIVLDKDRIVLVCACNTFDKTCQRFFIIKFLKKFGAVYKGTL